MCSTVTHLDEALRLARQGVGPRQCRRQRRGRLEGAAAQLAHQLLGQAGLQRAQVGGGLHGGQHEVLDITQPGTRIRIKHRVCAPAGGVPCLANI